MKYKCNIDSIPVKEEMRKKWLEVIGRPVNYKGARVCSDHFMQTDYHEMDQYRKKKRLLSTAVPHVSMQPISVATGSNICSNIIQEQE